MRSIFALLLFVVTYCAHAQTGYLKIHASIFLPKDSIESITLTTSLNAFLMAAQKTNSANPFVLESEKAETFILLDEIMGIEKSVKLKNDTFYKPYLTNIVSLKDSQYLIQVSYMGINNNEAQLRASFELIAHKSGNTFLFSSPLVRSTTTWKQATVGNIIFHYQHTLNKAKAKGYNKLVSSFDAKLNSKDKITEIYCCDNIIDLHKLIGVGYKLDYNGRTESIRAATAGNKKLIVLGNNNANFNTFDPHDLWHERLGLVIARSKVNKPVDEGCAYLYGGSWGLSWKEIIKAFKEKFAADTNINWAEVKEKPVYFKTAAFNNSADNIVNALIIQKIEKEKGFAGVWELLTVGPVEKGNEKYYQVLEKLTGITRATYNERVWELVRME
jgi:hypothetical protein